MQVRVSPEIAQLLDAAAAISVRQKLFFVGVEHLFEALLESSSLLPKPVNDRYLGNLQTVLREVTREGWKGGPSSTGGEVFYTPRCAHTLNDAGKLAGRFGHSRESAGHLLLAILADAHAAPSRAMDRLNVNRGEVIDCLREALTRVPQAPGGQSPEAPRAAAPVAQPGQAQGARPAAEAAREPEEGPRGITLESITRDLTHAARQGQLEPAIGRSGELFEILQILCRKNKNNVMLLGEAGVGKTQLVEGLAIGVAKDGLGGALPGFRILELNLSALMAGTQYRGALEDKLLGILDELKRSKNTVVFIDEVHLIMGAGATGEGSIDMANLLKPALARGEIRCIGATTLEEYRKFVLKDPAIERRFQIVRVEPLTEEASVKVLRKLRPSFERHHDVKISGKAIQAAVALTQRYMPNRHLPDKAIDVLDQACARYHLKAVAAQTNPRLLEETIEPGPVSKVTPHDIRKVISQVTAIPIEEMTAGERLFLSNLEQDLKKRIIGQDEAVAKAVAAVKKSRAGLADPNRPNAVMLFLGPSGVGKTQLAKLLADSLFGSTNHLVTFDMSEYIEAHSVSRLLGAAPGLVGSEEEGRLTRAVRNTPFSVLLFDEIEKAHPRIFDVLLPIFEEGRLKDARGRDVSFRNCIIILTSNIGAERMTRGDTHEAPEQLMAELRQHFRPEFINRIDEIVPFRQLLFEDIRTILGHSLRALGSRLKEKEIGLRVYQGAYEYLAQQGYSEEFGARELRRAVEQLVTAPISDLILRDRFRAGDTIAVLMEDGTLTFQKGEAPPKEPARTS